MLVIKSTQRQPQGWTKILGSCLCSMTDFITIASFPSATMEEASVQMPDWVPCAIGVANTEEGKRRKRERRWGAVTPAWWWTPTPLHVMDWSLGSRSSKKAQAWSRQVIREFAAQSDVWLEGHACFTNAATDTLLVFWKSELNNTRQLLEISGGGLHTNQSEQNAPMSLLHQASKGHRNSVLASASFGGL